MLKSFLIHISSLWCVSTHSEIITGHESLITRWLYFSKIWFILKELMQNQALFDMFQVLRNEGHYFRHIYFRLNLREANFPQYLDHMAIAFWYTSSLRYVPHTVKKILHMNSVTIDCISAKSGSYWKSLCKIKLFWICSMFYEMKDTIFDIFFSD